MAKSKFYKHPRFGHVYGDILATPIVRCAWPSLVTPKDPPPAKPGEAQGVAKYEVTLILDPKDEKHVAFIKQVKEMTKAMTALYNDNNSAPLGVCAIGKDGNKLNAEDKYLYYEDKIVIAARNASKPVVYAFDMSVADASIIQGGNLVKAILTPIVSAKGVSYRLSKIRFIKDDGVKFGGGVSDSKMTAMLSDDEDIESNKELLEDEVVNETSSKQNSKKNTKVEEDELIEKVPEVMLPVKESSGKTGKSKVVDLL